MSTVVGRNHIYKSHKEVPKDVMDKIIDFCDDYRNRDYVHLLVMFWKVINPCDCGRPKTMCFGCCIEEHEAAEL